MESRAAAAWVTWWGRTEVLAAEALGLMNKHGITALFVVDEARRPIGILHIHDLLRAGVA
jgi:arabinose-5-phosphate isomerase